MNLNKALDLIDNSYSELQNIRPLHVNPAVKVSCWAKDCDWLTDLAQEYLADFIEVRGLQDKKVSFEHHYVTDETCIWIDRRWSGYLDEYLIEEILLFRKERSRD